MRADPTAKVENPGLDLESFRCLTAEAAAGRSLTAEEAAGLMSAIMSGGVPDDLLADYLTALADKGETVDEIVGSATALRERAVPFAAPEDAIDTCGTGGDGLGTFNISTVTAIVAATAGQPVVKHGNRSASGRVGSTELLEALGVSTMLEPAESEDQLRRWGIAFLHAPRYHPAARHAAAVRRRLGRPTIFNWIGPLCNPARPAYQMLGTSSLTNARKLAEALLRLGIRRAHVVTGPNGLDELAPCGDCVVIGAASGRLIERQVRAEDAGLPSYPLDALQGGDAETNARMALDILAGQRGAPRDAVVMNAGMALATTGKAAKLVEGCRRCAECIDCGDAMALLRRLQSSGGGT